jgi:hypothetical protein
MALTLGSNTKVALTTLQTITTAATSWATVGSVLSSGCIDDLIVMAVIDINDTKDLRFKVQGSDTEAFTVAYELPIITAGASASKAEVQYVELNVDADQNILLPFNIGGVCKFARVQFQCSTVGASPAVMTLNVMQSGVVSHK